MHTADDRTVAEHLVAELLTAGVRHVFGVHGANIEDVFDAAARTGGRMQAVIAKHEFSAGAMADGYFRAANRLAAIATTSGGGALNLVPALGEAHASGVPVLALVGQPPRALAGRGAFQDQSGLAGTMDALDLLTPVSRFCARVEDPAEVGALLGQALSAARGGGPGVLLLPKDVQQAVLPARAATAVAPTSMPMCPNPHDVDGRLVGLLRAARSGHRRPLLIAGRGVCLADARHELAEFVDAVGAAVAVEPDAKDAFDNHHPGFVGLAGAAGHPSVARHLASATTCVLVGTRFPQVASTGLTHLLDGCAVLSIGGVQPPHVDHLVHLPGDPRVLLPMLSTGLSDLPAPRAPEQVRPLHLPHDRSGPERIALREVVEAVADTVHERATVVADAGNTGCGVLHFLPAPRRGRYLLAMGAGGMGWSFGAGIGAALATGGSVHVIAGDGSFLMHGLELHTAVEHDLPLTVVVLDNAGHAACSSRERFFYRDTGRPSSNVFRPIDIGAAVAALFGAVPAATVDCVEGLRSFLTDTAGCRGPRLVSVRMRHDETPPYLPFLPAATPERSPS